MITKNAAGKMENAHHALIDLKIRGVIKEKITAVLLAIIFCLLVNACIKGSRQEANMDRHELKNLGLSVLIPKEWEMAKSLPNSTVFRLDDNPHDDQTVAIAFMRNPAYDSFAPQSYFETVIDTLKGLPGIEEIQEMEMITIGGNEVRGLSFSQEKRKFIEYYFERDGKLYIVHCESGKEAFTHYESVFEKVLQNIKLD